MYGLAESPRCWYTTISKVLTEHNWKISEIEKCVYYKYNDDTELVAILTIFVDDFLFVGHEGIWEHLVPTLNNRFPVKDLGEPNKFLGLELTHTDSGIFISHTDYIVQMIKKFKLEGCHTKATPMREERLTKHLEKTEDPSLYQQTVGTLIHTAVYARPDVAFAVKELSQHMTSHSEIHHQAANRVMMYLNTTKYHALFAKKTKEFKIEIYTDADWAGNPVTRRSTTGFIAMVNGMIVTYYSRDQKSVSLSTCEAELYAISNALRLVTYLRGLLLEMNMIDETYEFEIQSDSKAAIALCQDDAGMSPQKHIDIRLKYIQEKIKSGMCKLVHVNGSLNLADIFTKPLGTVKYAQFLNKIMSEVSN